MAKKSARSKLSRASSKSARKSSGKSAKKSPRRSAKKSAKRSAAKSSTQSPLALLFPDLEAELSTTRRMLERVPNGNEDWRPHAKSRTLGELATHIAQLPGFGIMMLTTDEFDGLAGRAEPKLTSSTDRVKLFDEASGRMKRILQEMTWEQAGSTWTLRLGDRIVFQAPRTSIFRTVFITHSAHHRAQLGVYLRLLGTPVPWSYGRSADEEPSRIA